MKYKVGDKVRVKSLEWYNENKGERGDVNLPNITFVSNMSKFCGRECTICDVKTNTSTNVTYYGLEEDVLGYSWTGDMFERPVESNELNKVQDDEQTLKTVNDVDCEKPAVFENIVFPNEKYADKVELCLGDDYEIVVEDGRTFVQKKKPKYPKSFQECYCLFYGKQDLTLGCDIMRGAYNNMLECLQMLLICRDVYWRIAGEQMGLDKSCVPDWNESKPKYTIIVIENKLVKHYTLKQNYILAFPTEEMRDAFYENFKDLIEKCKELL